MPFWLRTCRLGSSLHFRALTCAAQNQIHAGSWADLRPAPESPTIPLSRRGHWGPRELWIIPAADTCTQCTGAVWSGVMLVLHPYPQDWWFFHGNRTAKCCWNQRSRRTQQKLAKPWGLYNLEGSGSIKVQPSTSSNQSLTKWQTLTLSRLLPFLQGRDRYDWNTIMIHDEVAWISKTEKERERERERVGPWGSVWKQCYLHYHLVYHDSFQFEAATLWVMYVYIIYICMYLFIYFIEHPSLCIRICRFTVTFCVLNSTAVFGHDSSKDRCALAFSSQNWIGNQWKPWNIAEQPLNLLLNTM